jgi:ADP-ribosyl-[dinitrogen reductase] hydrolase
MTVSFPVDRWREAFAGVLLGTAVGDALGLPAEGLSRRRIEKRWRGCWRHRFLLGRGWSATTPSCHQLADAVASGKSVQELADALGLQRGVTGYAYHTVPVALCAWLRHSGDFRAALTAALNCGGDTDTVGAIVGALLGATVGPKGIPSEWVQGICEWPRSVALLARVAERLAYQKVEGGAPRPVHYFWPAVLLRNVVFLLTVLVHGLRRLAPPY